MARGKGRNKLATDSPEAGNMIDSSSSYGLGSPLHQNPQCFSFKNFVCFIAFHTLLFPALGATLKQLTILKNHIIKPNIKTAIENALITIKPTLC